MELNGRSVLVTGADGFIGSHLTEALVARGARVRALSQYNSFNFWGWLEHIKYSDNVEVVSGDIRDPFYCEALTKGVDVVFHLAALITIPYSYIAPASYVETNVIGTTNLCQAARNNRVERFIHTSTSEVYGTAHAVPIDEHHPLQAQSPYSASKIAADAMAMSFYHAFELPIVIARPFNTFGPRQSARAVIPTILTQMIQGHRQIKLGTLTTTRDFTFVEDTCAGLIALAEANNAVGETVNIGSNEEISIGELFNLIKELMNSSAEATCDPGRLRPEKSEVERLVCDNTSLIRLTNFKTKYSLRNGLEKTIAWFTNQDNLRLYKADIYNV